MGAYYHGHRLFWDPYVEWWYFEETGETLDRDREEHENMICKRCKRRPTSEGHDGCIGKLPGVRHACCGHGVVKEAYIEWKDGVVSRFDNEKPLE